ARLRLETRLERGDPDARPLGGRPAASEEVRSADRAEGLRGALLGLERANEFFPVHDPDGRGRHADVRGAGTAGEPLARRAMAEPQRRRLGVDLEPHAAAKTASAHHGVIVEPGGTLGSDTVRSRVTVPPRPGLSCNAGPSAIPRPNTL